MIIKFKITCPNCGEIIEHVNLDTTQNNPEEVEIDVDALVNAIDFECPNCGCEVALESYTYSEVVRRCRVCGCTDTEACEGGCYWVEYNLCSNCVDKKDE